MQLAESMSETPIRVIVIDDEPVVRQYLEVALTEFNCTVELFDSCQAGLTRCETVDFDLVFVDKNLPDGTGMDVCEKLANADCKVALITGYANLNSAVEALRYGVSEYFIKPIDINDLEARVSRMYQLLNLERSNRELVRTLQVKCTALEEVATRDPVTGLCNHRYFQDRMASEISRRRRGDGFTVAEIAIDRFSAVNKLVGHQEGDRVLKWVAQFISAEIEQGEVELLVGCNALVSRLGGDVFGVLLPDMALSTAAARLQGLRERLNSRCPKDFPEITISIGMAQFPEDGADQDALHHACEVALRTAKRAGGDSLISYRRSDDDPSGAAAKQLERVRALGRSLTSGSFRFVYQPIVDAESWKPIAYEALCRPTDATFAHVGELIETTARAGRLEELGGVLRRICVEPIGSIPQECLLFVNLHPQDLSGELLFHDNSPLHPFARQIVLEITETEAIHDFEEAWRRLAELRKRGYRIALDDFGAGYSGFNSLARLEPDFVKLDMAIVRNIQAGSRAARLTRHIREFCEVEGITTIAEGVETWEELQVLRGLGIRYFQGYLFAKPASPFCKIVERGETVSTICENDSQEKRTG